MIQHRILIAAAAAAIATTAGAPAGAQGYPQGPGAANLSVANGSVVVVRGDGGAQAAATVNSPILPGDYVTTGSGSDAEIQFDGESMLRLAQNTQVRVVNLNAGMREVQLAAGTVDVAELQGSGGGAQLDTPSLNRPSQPVRRLAGLRARQRPDARYRSQRIRSDRHGQYLADVDPRLYARRVGAVRHGDAVFRACRRLGLLRPVQCSARPDDRIGVRREFVRLAVAGGLCKSRQLRPVAESCPATDTRGLRATRRTSRPTRAGSGSGNRAMAIRGLPRSRGDTRLPLWDVVQRRAVRRMELAAARLSISVDAVRTGVRMGAGARVVLPHRQQCERHTGTPECLARRQRVSELLRQLQHRLGAARPRRAVPAVVRTELQLSRNVRHERHQRHQRLPLLDECPLLSRRHDGARVGVARGRLPARRRAAAEPGTPDRPSARRHSRRSDGGEPSLCGGRTATRSRALARLLDASIASPRRRTS